MRNALFAITAAAALLVGCRQSADDQAANNAASNRGQVLPITDESPVVAAAPASKEEALKLMHDRHEGMEDIGDAFKVLGRETKADAPNVEAVRASAETVARLAPEVS